MPYLFPDPLAEDLSRYSFKIRMTKVPGGFKPTSIEAVKYMLTNPAYIGAWIYNDAIVREGNHPAIADYELFRWTYQTLTGRNLQGEHLNDKPPRRRHGADALLKHILRDPTGLLYVVRPEHPEYIRQELVRDVARDGRLRRDITFAIRAYPIDTIFIDRIKDIARGNAHLAGDIRASLTDLQQQHTRALVSIEDQLKHVRMEQKKLLAFLQAQILDLTDREIARYKELRAGLRRREEELLAVHGQSMYASLQAGLDELSDLLADISGKLDDCSLERKQRLARLLTENVTIEEVSVHWLRSTVVWRGTLSKSPDVCLIWRQRGRRSDSWTAEEDAYIAAHYRTADKWAMLQALPRRSWNMIYQRALGLGVQRAASTQEDLPLNICIEDLEVIPDPDLAMALVLEASRRRERSGMRDLEQGSSQLGTYPVWLHPANNSKTAAEGGYRTLHRGS